MNLSESKNNEATKWFAIYTKPRSEKKTHELLLRNGFQSYCPINRVRKRYSDRYKWVDEVLFRSYLFIKINERQINEIRLVPGVLNFVYKEKAKIAVISEKDINNIKKFLQEHDDVFVESIDTKSIIVGQTVRIDAGLFMDSEAIVKKIKKDKIVVELKSLGLKMTAELSKSDIHKI